MITDEAEKVTTSVENAKMIVLMQPPYAHGFPLFLYNSPYRRSHRIKHARQGCCRRRPRSWRSKSKLRTFNSIPRNRKKKKKRKKQSTTMTKPTDNGARHTSVLVSQLHRVTFKITTSGKKKNAHNQAALEQHASFADEEQPVPTSVTSTFQRESTQNSKHSRTTTTSERGAREVAAAAA